MTGESNELDQMQKVVSANTRSNSKTDSSEYLILGHAPNNWRFISFSQSLLLLLLLPWNKTFLHREQVHEAI